MERSAIRDLTIGATPALRCAPCVLHRNHSSLRLYSLAGVRHFGTALQSPPQRRGAAVGAGLIIDAEAAHDFGEDARVGRLFHLEGIEARPHQKMKLIAQNIAGGAQRAAKTVGLTQEARLAIGAAVAEFRKMEHYQRQVAEPRLQLRDTAVVRP